MLEPEAGVTYTVRSSDWRKLMGVQYVTNERGERAGVLLDVATYHQIRLSTIDDPELQQFSV